MVAWDPAPAVWSDLAYAADGAVRCTYNAVIQEPGGASTLSITTYYAEGFCDLDDDDNLYASLEAQGDLVALSLSDGVWCKPAWCVRGSTDCDCY